jgi:hypothetical protein
MKAADFWEKAFRGTMTLLLSIVLSIAGVILKENRDNSIRLARIEAEMPKRIDIVDLQNKIYLNEKRILTLELTCSKRKFISYEAWSLSSSNKHPIIVL